MGLGWRISHLAGLGDIVDGIVGGIVGWIQYLIDGYLALLANWFYTIFLAFATILDVIQLLFRKLAGLENYVVNGVETAQPRDLALEIINNQAVMNIFWSLAILSIVLLLISTFVAVIKSEYQPLDAKGGNSKGKIIGKSLKSVAIFATVPVVAILGLFIGNALLSTLDMATSSGANSKLSGRIFAAAAYESNRAREGVGPFDQEFLDDLSTKNNFGLFSEDTNTGFIIETVADKIDNAFQNNTLAPTGEDFDPVASNDILSFVYKMIGLPDYPESFSIYNYKLVWYYYDLSNFNFFVAIGVTIMLITIMLMVLLGLIKRIYALVMLFIIAPPIIAITPINEDAYKNWKKAFISNTLSIYAVIVTMNLYIMLIPILGQIDFFQIDSETSAVVAVTYQVFNLIAQLLMLIGGAVFFKDFSKQLADIIGASDVLGDGAGKAEAFTKTAAKAVALGTGIGATGFALQKGAVKAVGSGFKNSRANGLNWMQAASKGVGAGLVTPFKNAANMGNKFAKGAKNFAGFGKDNKGNRIGFLKDKADRFESFKKSSFGKNLGFDKLMPLSAAAQATKDRSNRERPELAADLRNEKLIKALEGKQGTTSGADDSNKANDVPLTAESTLNLAKSGYVDESKAKLTNTQSEINSIKDEINEDKGLRTRGLTPETVAAKKAQIKKLQQEEKIYTKEYEQKQKGVKTLESAMKTLDLSLDDIIENKKKNVDKLKNYDGGISGNKKIAQDLKEFISKTKDTVNTDNKK